MATWKNNDYGKEYRRLKKKARYELKFVTETSRYSDLEQWILNHGRCFFKEYPDRKVNNIYFDNHDLDSYSENLSGISSRTKIRLRWYGDQEDLTAKPTNLELKIKKNKIGWKHSEPIIFNQNFQNLTKNEIVTTITKQLSNYFKNRFYFSNLPILVNTYERRYYVSADRRVRITLDKNLVFYDQRLTERLNFVNLYRPANIIVMECKCGANDLDYGQKVVEKIFLPPSKCSKYVLGVQTFLGV